MDLAEKEKKEIEFYSESDANRSGTGSLENLFYKMSDGQIFCEVIKPFDTFLKNAQSVMEIGGGQGWATCILKRIYPHLYTVMTDISPAAVEAMASWETLFGVAGGRRYACRSYATNEGDAGLDCVFCFSAAHHFVLHKETLLEMKRILKPGGKCLYLYEVSSSTLLQPLARARYNKIKGMATEDVLAVGTMKKTAQEAGLDCRINYCPLTIRHGPLEMMYYLVLQKVPILQKILPCTVTYEFTKSI